MELIYNFNYDDEYVKLQGQQINIGEEGITKVFKLPCEGLMVAKEGYNNVATTYFIGTQQDHYVLKLGYVITQANGHTRVGRLIALIKILTFCQGNQ
jgi:hypothetical protein